MAWSMGQKHVCRTASCGRVIDVVWGAFSKPPPPPPPSSDEVLRHGPKPRLSKKTLFLLGAMYTIDCINGSLLTPYVDVMVSGFMQTTPDDPRVAPIVGFLIGVYPLCEVIFSPIWGVVSDRVGRKPALLIGLGGSVVAPIIFGLGTDLVTVFLARALDGIFCGNISVTKTYLGEVVDKTNEAKAFNSLSMCFRGGLFIGPILGGPLVYPATWAPSIFAGTIFEQRPFLLPNLTYAMCAAVAWILGAAFLEETLPKSKRDASSCCLPPRWRCWRREQQRGGQQQVGTTPTPDTAHRASPDFSGDAEVAAAVAAGGDRIDERPLGTCVLVQVIICSCALTAWSAAANQLFILIVSLPQSVEGGFGFGPQQIGMLRIVAAASSLVVQLFFYKQATMRLGLLWSFILGASASSLTSSSRSTGSGLTPALASGVMCPGS